MNQSHELFERAKKIIPGGVNSPVRAFRSVGGTPFFTKKASGSYLTTVDDKKLLDYVCTWGPAIHGHDHPVIREAISKALQNGTSFGTPGPDEVEMAELLVDIVPSVEKVRMCNSGTEATMSAIRLARGYTGRDKIVKFEGCYHGHGDSFLIAAGSGVMTLGEPNSPGVTRGVAKDTLTVPFNDLERLEEVINANKDQVAAIIVEPVAGNMGCTLPAEGYLQGMRELCDANGIVLIFDEVMTGFRLSKAGAQGVYDVKPDLTTLGKIIGGGMPVGAYGGKKEIMDYVSPQGPVYQAGTLSGNPVAMAAGMAMLTQINESESIYTDLANTTEAIEKGFQANLDELGLGYTMNRIGSMVSLFFTDQKVIDFDTAKSSNTEKFGLYFREMLNNGVYLPPSQFETLFISTSITEDLVGRIVEANRTALKKIH